uniref:Kringle domain-containing protein n=1 Tax=Branchiostoma floridae TaxID=7739 RepID=C3YH34_BRAFL|eukprot:XP_002604259.1 hypothetical protein BRAFLDRAFT_88548 [Branchiostoma floridae]
MLMFTNQMQQKAAQIYGLIGGGYSVWITALRIKGRASDIPAKTEEMKSELNTVGTSLLEYTKPKNWRTDWHCGSAYPADNGEAAKCHPDSKFPCCSPHNWCGNTADHCSCSGCVDYRAPQGKAERNLNQAEVADLENRILRILEAGDNKEPPQEQQQEPLPVDHVTPDTAVDGMKQQQDVSERVDPVEDIVTRDNTGRLDDKTQQQDVDERVDTATFPHRKETSGGHLIMTTASVKHQTVSAIMLTVFKVLRLPGTPMIHGPVMLFPPKETLQVLYNLLEMMKPQSGLFGGKSLFDIYKERLINDNYRLEKKHHARTEMGLSTEEQSVSPDTGKPCQRWTSQSPHEHSYTPANYPSSGLEQNYCRNPDGESVPGVWCYTTHQGTRWEYCDVPQCNEETCQRGNGVSYKGTASVTESGKTCQRWDSQTPHEHGVTPAEYPSSLLLKNYCRSLGGDSSAFGVWCYTTDPSTRWEYCDVPACAEPCQVGDGVSYRGTVSVTESGKTCQRWDSQSPHEHIETLDNYPEAGLLKNYCRSQGGDSIASGVWCYTTDPSTRWEYCDVPRC